MVPSVHWQVALALTAVQAAKGLHHDDDLQAAFHVAVSKSDTGTRGTLPTCCPLARLPTRDTALCFWGRGLQAGLSRVISGNHARTRGLTHSLHVPYFLTLLLLVSCLCHL